MVTTPEHLLKRMAKSDETAFLEFHDGFSPRIFGLLVKLISPRTEAEDVLQEVMLEIWQKSDRYDEALGSALSWSLMLARSRAIDHLRKRGREQDRLRELRTEWETGRWNDHRDQDLAEPVRMALGQLPDEQRALVVSAYSQGLSREQMAQVFDMPVGTVKTRLRSGVQSLRDSLIESGVHA